MNFWKSSKASIDEKPKSSLRKALTASLDSLSRAVKSLDFKKRTNTTSTKDTKKAPRNAKNEKEALPMKRMFALETPETPSVFSGSEKTLLQTETSKNDVIIPTLNTSSINQTEDAYRNRLLRDLITNKTKLHSSFTENYILGDLLGDGAFGFVFSAKSKEGKELAVKFIIKSKISNSNWVDLENGDRAPQEVAILRSLDHPNIVKFVEYINDDEFVLLITELHGTSWHPSNPVLDPRSNPGIKVYHRPTPQPLINSRPSCDLFECIDAHEAIPIQTAKLLFAQILLACEYLEKRGLVHRDIKDENIVVDATYSIKLIDFGSASYIPTNENDYFTRYNGTPHFAPPEIVRRKPYKGPKAEMWALGVLLYTIIFGENPFHTDRDILAYNGLLLTPRFIDGDLRRLLQGMLCVDPKKRYTLQKVMANPWVSMTITELRKVYQTK